jgi:hypothetical protein
MASVAAVSVLAVAAAASGVAAAAAAAAAVMVATETAFAADTDVVSAVTAVASAGTAVASADTAVSLVCTVFHFCIFGSDISVTGTSLRMPESVNLEHQKYALLPSSNKHQPKTLANVGL